MRHYYYKYKIYFIDGRVEKYSHCSEITSENFAGKNNLLIYKEREVDFDDSSPAKIINEYKYCRELKAVINMDQVEYIEVNVKILNKDTSKHRKDKRANT